MALHQNQASPLGLIAHFPVTQRTELLICESGVEKGFQNNRGYRHTNDLNIKHIKMNAFGLLL